MTATVTIDASAESPALFCPACGYELRGIDSDRCPECGLSIDRTAAGQSTLPWSHRRRIGRLRAYRQTVFRAIFHPFRFASEIDRPVSLADARAFRRVTVAFAFAPIALVIIAAYVATFESPPGWTPLAREFAKVVPNGLAPLILGRPACGWISVAYAMELFVLASTLIATWLWLLAAAAAASYWFHPPTLDMTRQNRAVSLSYYACAPLVATPITVALVVAAVLVRLRPNPSANVNELMNLIAAVAAWIQLTAWWGVSMTLFRLLTRCGLIHVAAFVTALPIMWAILAMLILGGIVGTAVLLAVVAVTMI